MTRQLLTDLHVHLPGTVRAGTFAELAQANGVPLPLPASELYARINSDPTAAERARGPWFPLLRVYEWISASIRSRDDFARVVYEALDDEWRLSGVCYAELAFSPSEHARLGVAYADMIAGIEDGIERARHELGVDARMIAAVNREDTPEAAVDMVRHVLEHPSPAVVGIGLDFYEPAGMPETFVDAFTLAAHGGLHRTAHAGEHAPTAETVEAALDVLGCERIDHGYQVLRDPAIVRRCADAGVIFNVAFTTSRHALLAWRRESIRAMVHAGLRVSINSDDPALFPTTTAAEMAIAAEVLGDAAVPGLVANGIDAAFLPESDKRALRARAFPGTAPITQPTVD